MKELILLSIVVIMSFAETIKTANICTCDKITAQVDCQTMIACSWTPPIAATNTINAIPGFCENIIKTSPTAPKISQTTFSTITIAARTITSTYCDSISTPAINCWKTFGCAYVDNQCTQFTGCTAYVKTSSQQCQAISQSCISDGTSCFDISLYVSGKTCTEFTTQTDCVTTTSISGIKKCKWDNYACRDYVCTEADNTLKTDAACDTWLSGCVTTGRGCTTILEACASYVGDYQTCFGLIGSDGHCRGLVGGNNCHLSGCIDAPETLITDKDCNQYQKGCITKGRGCTTSPLPLCSSYQAQCQGYIGQDGYCEAVLGASSFCRARLCKDAPASNNSDAQCDAYQIGCKTNGRGCLNIRQPCSSYFDPCEGYIGSDGYCKSNHKVLCSPKICQEAPIYLATNELCAQYQIGCLTTGKGCIAILGKCSSYVGTTLTCEGFIGSDGKCKGTNITINSPCTPKTCAEAPQGYITNEACASFQIGCVTNGIECLNQTTCPNTIKQSSCTGTPGCGWNSICVASQYCTDFKTASICSCNNAVLTTDQGTQSTPCYWDGKKCSDLTCTQAPVVSITDQLCDSFLKGCLTKGKGCLSPTALCSSYVGTQATCESFTRKCSNSSAAGAATVCKERSCTDNIVSITDQDCASYLSGCRTNGAGCLHQSKLCSAYSGIQDKCDGFRGSNITKRCWNISTTKASACIEKLCTHNTTSKSDSECDMFLIGCLTNGLGCISNTLSCSSYSGTQYQCNNFTGNSGANICWNVNAITSGLCTEKLCTHAPSDLNSDITCGQFLTGCLTNGHGCVSPSLPCTSYSGTRTECSAFTGNKQKCYNNDNCDVRNCFGKINPVNDADCKSYLSTCSYFNGICLISANCTSYIGTNLAVCSEVLNVSGIRCWWVAGSTTCIDRSCANAPGPNSTGCSSHLQSCQFNGSVCLNTGQCSSYVAYGVDNAALKTNCETLQNTSGTYCGYNSGSNCIDRACAYALQPINQNSCDQYLKDKCSWNGTACVVKSSCSTYLPIPMSGLDSDKSTICKQMKDNISTNYCTFYSGICKPRVCNTKINAGQASDCTNHLPTCRYTGVPVCVNANEECNYEITGATTLAKVTACELLKSSSGALCTFINGTSTCKVKLCSDVLTPANLATCTAVKFSCQFSISGQPCIDTNSACTYSIPTTITTDANKTTYCLALDDGAGNSCGFTTGATTCRLGICGDIKSPVNLAVCTAMKSSCQFSISGQPCIDTNSACAYSIPTAITTDANKTTYCLALDDGAWSSCGFTTGATICRFGICQDIKSPANQAACTAMKSSCQFSISGQPCIDTNSACTYSIPTAITTDANKKTYCLALDNGSGISCGFTNGATVCRSKNCSDSGTNPANLAVCTAIKTTCQFISTSVACFEADIECAYTPTAGNELTYCKSLNNGSGNQCNWTAGKTTCRLGVCDDVTSPANQAACTIIRASCQFSISGQPCIDTNSACTYSIPNTISSGSKEVYCLSLDNGSGNVCGFTFGDTTCRLGFCEDITNPSNQVACSSMKASCKFISSSQKCVETNSTCTYFLPINLTSNADKLSYCLALNNGANRQCGYTSESTTCSYANCNQIIAAADTTACGNQISSCEINPGCSARSCDNLTFTPYSNTDCLSWSRDCRFNGSICIQSFVSCEYIFAGAIAQGTDAEKLTFCNLLTNSSDVGCTLNLAKKGCTLRTCANLQTVISSISDCNNWLPTCRYNGYNCINADTCSKYIANSTINASLVNDNTKASYCLALTNNAIPPTPCGFVNTAIVCIERTCANIRTTPSSDFDCSQWLSSCTISNKVTAICISNTSACTAFTGTASQCQSYSQVSGDNIIKCWSVSGASVTTPVACKVKECSDNKTSTTNEECSSFFPRCKYNGTMGCVLNPSMLCSNYLGNSTTCVNFKSSDGNYCTSGTAKSKACTIRVCSDDGASTTDLECSSFLMGCVTKGVGCIADSEPCTKYIGTQQKCSTFKGNGKKCWNVSSGATNFYCVDRKCSDDKTSNTDFACQSNLQGCITNGSGCIDQASQCTAFIGDQTICSQFKGFNGTKLCWNTYTASQTTSCIDRICNHNTTAKTDPECETFLPRVLANDNPRCVTNGSGCVDYPVTCSSFVGTTEQCGLFTASDGPCKSTSVTISASCTPRICAEALNLNISDALCKAYHPSCVTNGYGCVSSVQCQDIQQLSACSGKIGCSWVNNCQTIVTDCSALTIYGASVCVNTPVTSGTRKCAWYIKDCRAQTSEDITATVTTNQECQGISTDYTTTGSGCTLLGPCTSYPTEQVCKVAMTTDVGYTCVWDTTTIACRAKRCTDATNISTDYGCEVYLAGCRTNGISCIPRGYSCSSLLTASSCFLDDHDMPCLWVNNFCYNFSRCEDISLTTHEECQVFSTQCTTSGEKCIAITSCAKITLQQSCKVGTDGICGWLPTQECRKFTTCSDAAGTDNTSCAVFKSNCVTDGTKCVEKGTCSTYLTQIACDSQGTDGLCIFAINFCRLRECNDATNVDAQTNTHSGCNSYIAKTKCTTNGTSCIPLSTCSSYKTQAGCVLGTDGTCVYSLPVGTEIGIASCRLKTCFDLQQTAPMDCSAQIGCTTDGTTCLSMALCSAYTSKMACNGGGTDGQCAFTPGSIAIPTVGRCKLMKACSDANNDSFACIANSAACQWLVTYFSSIIMTKCSPHTCSTKSQGSSCVPVPSFDLKSYIVCDQTVTKGCTEVSGSELSATTCQALTMKTYTWNVKYQICTACFTNADQTSNINGGETTNTSERPIIKPLIALVVLVIVAI